MKNQYRKEHKMQLMYIHRLTQLLEHLQNNELKAFEPQTVIFFDSNGQGQEYYYNSYIFRCWPELYHGFYFAGEIPVFCEDKNDTSDWIIVPGNPVHPLADVLGLSPFRARTVWSALCYYGMDKEEFLSVFECEKDQPTNQDLIIKRLKMYIKHKEKGSK